MFIKKGKLVANFYTPDRKYISSRELNTGDIIFLCAGRAETVVFALFSKVSAGKGSVDLEPKHVDLIKKFAALENGPAVVVVSFGSPYFLRNFPEVDAYVCLYRSTPETQNIAARALVGEMDLGGKLPVSIPDLYPVGHGIELQKKKS